MTSEVLHSFASRCRAACLAIGTTFAVGGCAVASEPTDTGSPESVTPASAALVQITDREYVDSVRDVLGVTLTGADVAIGGITGASATETRFNEMMAVSYQTAAERVAIQANLTALLGSEKPSTAQVQTFLTDKVSRLWHRPLTSAEVSRLTTLYDAGAPSGAPNAFTMVLEAVLQAPSFLFHS